MPVDADWFLSLADEVDDSPSLTGDGRRKWEAVWSPHPEGGGAFGGRDNALTVFAGFMRAKSVPYVGAVSWTRSWNQEYCLPPLSDEHLRVSLARKWAEWAEGGHTDRTADGGIAEPHEWKLMTALDLLELEEGGGGVSWLIDKAVVEHGLNLVTSPPGGAKSWFMLDMARRLAHGEDWFLDIPLEQTGCLYLDAEMGEASMSSRVKKLGFHRDAPFYYLGRENIKLQRHEDVKRLVDIATEREVSIIFMDTLIRFHDYEENNNTEMARLLMHMRPLQEAGITLFIGHHDRKSGVGDSKVTLNRARGAGDLPGQMDMAFGIDSRGGNIFGLSVTKPRHMKEDDAKRLTLDFAVEDYDDGERTRVRELTGDERGAHKHSHDEETVIEALANGPMSTNELSDVADIRKENAIVCAKRLVDRGRLETRKAGNRVYYALPGGFPDADD